MEWLVTLNSGRNGRDKIFRAAQYALKLVNAFQVNNRLRVVQYIYVILVSISFPFLKASEKALFVDTVELERSLASFRKLLRLGTCVDTAYGVRETLGHADPVVRWTATLRRVSLALYLYYDHLVCNQLQSYYWVNSQQSGNIYFTFTVKN